MHDTRRVVNRNKPDCVRVGGGVHKYSSDRTHSTTLLNVIAAYIRTLTNGDQQNKDQAHGPLTT
jgi:hypothetical protein